MFSVLSIINCRKGSDTSKFFLASRLRRKVYPELVSGHFIFLLLIELRYPWSLSFYISNIFFCCS